MANFACANYMAQGRSLGTSFFGAAPENSIEGLSAFIDHYNRSKAYLDSFTSYLKGVGRQRDTIIQKANAAGYQAENTKVMGVTPVDVYIKYIKQYVSQYSGLVKRLDALKTTAIFRIFNMSVDPLTGNPYPEPLFTKYPEAYKYIIKEGMFNPLFDAVKKLKLVYGQLITSIEEIAMQHRVNWPPENIFNIVVPVSNLADISSTKSFVTEVQTQQEAKRQVIGLDTTTVNVPRFNIDLAGTQLAPEKRNWTIPLIIGGGAIAAALALRG